MWRLTAGFSMACITYIGSLLVASMGVSSFVGAVATAAVTGMCAAAGKGMGSLAFMNPHMVSSAPFEFDFSHILFERDMSLVRHVKRDALGQGSFVIVECATRYTAKVPSSECVRMKCGLGGLGNRTEGR